MQPGAATEAVYRVRVVQEASGSVRIADVDTVDVVQGDGVPLAPLGGTHLLVGLGDGDIALDGQELRFPGVLEVGFDDRFSDEEIDITGREVDSVGYVRALAGVRELGIVDEGGNVVVRSAVPSASEAKAVGASQSSLTQASANCKHVRLLEGEADRDWATGAAYYSELTLIEPGPTQRAVIEGALGLMTPLMCHAVSRIAVAQIPTQPGVGGVVAQLAAGDLVVLNEDVGYRESDLVASEEQRLQMMQTVIHEAAHSAESILNAEGKTSQDFNGEWSFDSRTVASDTVDNVRIESGLLIEWQRSHAKFVNQGWALPHVENVPNTTAAVRQWDATKTAESGFMSRYGAANYAEDIAETTAWAYMGHLFGAAGIPEGRRQKEDFGCQIMKQYESRNVPSRLAAVYSKLFFLKDLGLIHPEDVDKCTGPNIGLPIDSSGFHVWQNDIQLRSYEQAVTAGIGTAPNGRIVYEMRAEGEAGFGDELFPADWRLQLELAPAGTDVDLVSWPRGVYELGLTGDNHLELRLEGAAAGNFDVSEGFVFVAESSNERIAGSAFVEVVWRLNAPIPVPEVYDPPLFVRFLIEN